MNDSINHLTDLNDSITVSMNTLVNNVIYNTYTVKDALWVLNDLGVASNVLFIVDENNQLFGTLTDGDIRRGLLEDLDVKSPAVLAANTNFKFIRDDCNTAQKVKQYKQEGIRFVPLLDENNVLLSVLDLHLSLGFLPVNAVIMAGGKGQRLMPLTANIPKPMLKVGTKPILEHNIDRLVKFGITNIHISINYLGHIITNYFDNGSSKNINIQYLEETKPLGTIGSVKLTDKYERDYILLMNSDLLTDINFEDFFTQFVESKADMSVATIPYNIDIPYAVLETNKENTVLALSEKPRYTYFSNAGIYLFKKQLLDMIPCDEFYNATDLMEAVIEQGKKLITFPILGYWLDIGRINDYLKAQEDIKHLQF